ncbi:hypothetical protein SAMN04489742_4671 [Arthrobacter crystallopoietes]|uniref:Uncharacterized protein n=1 Tax=Crystallibacter crystallopoietes TaxID=37928 RepID=A0A1H1HVE8_9MICC|nr:hypothetical protein SAMN04489742_4671 [Arthrobacter crystallopoietes]
MLRLPLWVVIFITYFPAVFAMSRGDHAPLKEFT